MRLSIWHPTRVPDSTNALPPWRVGRVALVVALTLGIGRRRLALLGLGARRLGSLLLLLADQPLALRAISAGQLLTGGFRRLRLSGSCSQGDQTGERADHAQAEVGASNDHRSCSTACGRGSSRICQGQLLTDA